MAANRAAGPRPRPEPGTGEWRNGKWTGKWCISFDSACPRPDGSRRQIFRSGFTTRGAASKELTRLLEADRPPEADGLTVEDVLDDFIAEKTLAGRAPNTLAQHRLASNRAKELWGGWLAESLTYRHINKQYLAWQEGGRKQYRGGPKKRKGSGEGTEATDKPVPAPVREASTTGMRAAILARPSTSHWGTWPTPNPARTKPSSRSAAPSSMAPSSPRETTARPTRGGVCPSVWPGLDGTQNRAGRWFTKFGRPSITKPRGPPLGDWKVVRLVECVLRTRRVLGGPSVQLGAMLVVVLALGGSDCEALHDGWLGQPVNSLSSLAYVAAAVYVLRSAGPPLPAVALGAVGVGSVLYHGPMPESAEAVHDGSILALTATMLVAWRRGSLVRPPVSAAIAAAGAVTLNVLTRTDAPLCRPDSLLQGHAGWHVLTAVAAALWLGTSTRQPERRARAAARGRSRPSRSRAHIDGRR